MNYPARLLVTVALITALYGCHQNSTSASSKTARLCDAIKDSGITRQCSVSNLAGTVGIVVDTNDEAARNMCAGIANRIKPQLDGFTGNWRLEIFSPLRDDKPLAYCSLL